MHISSVKRANTGITRRPEAGLDYDEPSKSHIKRPTGQLFVSLLTALLVLLLPVRTIATGTHSVNLIVGISAHPLRSGRNFRVAINKVAATGATSIRFDARWPRFERTRGKFQVPAQFNAAIDYALSKGIKPLLILDTVNDAYQKGRKPTMNGAVVGFANYAKNIAAYFKGRVYMYEVWNEWDNPGGWHPPGTAEQYYRLLKVTYQAIKSVDPSIQILGGSLTSGALRGRYLTDLIQTGALQFMDGLSIHPYNDCKRGHSVKQWTKWLTSIEDKLKDHSQRAAFPIYITEYGAPAVGTRCGEPMAARAELAYNTIIAASQLPFVRGIWWYDLYSGPPDARKPDPFGLFASDWQPTAIEIAFSRAVAKVNIGAK